MAAANVSLAAVRRLAIVAQGYAPRHRAGTAAEVAAGAWDAITGRAKRSMALAQPSP